MTDARLRVSGHAPAAEQTYVGERSVGEEREAFEQVLVVVVLDHRRSVGLEQKLRGVTKPNECGHTLFRHQQNIIKGGADSLSAVFLRF